MSRGKIFVISGPSGVGKSTVVEQVLKQVNNIYLSISATTREIRTGEKDGINYFYKTKNEFQTMIDSNDFLEWAEYAGNLYGTPKSFVESYTSNNKDVLLEIEVEGAKQVKSHCTNSILIFLAPPSFDVLKERLTGRKTESLEDLKKRLNKAQEEIQKTNIFNHCLVNDKLEDTVNRVSSIIREERCKSN